METTAVMDRRQTAVPAAVAAAAPSMVMREIFSSPAPIPAPRGLGAIPVAPVLAPAGQGQMGGRFKSEFNHGWNAQ